MDFSDPWNNTCSSVGQCARAGALDIMKQLIDQGKSVDVADNRGWRPLHEAAALPVCLDCMEELLKHENTDVNWMTHEGETALLLACKRRRDATLQQAVELLLENGADPNIGDNEKDSPLLEVLRNGNFNVVRQLIENAKVDVNSADCSGWHPLHEAAKQGNVEMLNLLLNAGARLRVQDECGMTPIFTAAHYGKEEALQALLDCAVAREEISIINVGAEDWATPLMIAVQQDFVECVKLLLAHGADPDLQTCDSALALHMAVQVDSYRCLDLLLEKINLEPLIRLFHPFSEQSAPFDIICPLHLAVEWKSYKCLEKLLAAGFSPDSLYNCITGVIWERAPPEMTVPQFETALSYAVYHKDKEAIGILLRAGAHVNPVPKATFHPFLRALYCSSMEVIDMLIENGSDVNYSMMNLPTNELLLLSLSGKFSILKDLLGYGCDPNLCFQEGNALSLNLFLRCIIDYAHNKPKTLRELLMLLLNFVVVTKPVQVAFRTLCARAKGCPHTQGNCELWDEIAWIVNEPSTLKQTCFVKLRQHMYRCHGMGFVKKIHSLALPPTLKDYLLGKHLNLFTNHKEAHLSQSE